MTLATRTVTNYLDEIAAPDGALKANTEIVFQLVDTAKRLPAALFDAVDGKYVTGTQVSVTTDVNGYFTASLWPNTRGEYATCYKVTLPATAFKPVYIRVTEGDGSLSFLAARSNMEEISPQTTSLFDGLLSSITQALGTVTALATSTASGLMPFSDKAKLDAITGTNTGDETTASIKTKLGITTLSGDNTGDETAASIKTKLGITTLSGVNTGDQDLSGYLLKSGSLTDLTMRNHSDLSGAGTNTHAAIDTALTRLANTSGTNTGTNTGDETAASIKAKLGVTTLSGSNTGDQDLSGFAPLASPAFTGTPAAPTAAANTNTTQLATTAFVLGQKGTSTPAATATGGVGVVGTSTLYSPMDHAHPIGDAHTLDGFHASQTGAVNSCVTTNANGHVGLGVAPFGWGPRAVDFVNGGALSCFSTGTMYISVNAYNDNTNWRHKATGAAATAYISALGGFNVLLAPSAAAGATTSLASIISADASGNLIIAGATATKASGTSWANPSDRRLKDEIAQYARGLDVIRQLAVREWVFNGKGGTLAGTRGVGVIADEAEVVIPEIVAEYQGRLDPEGENVALKKVDPSELFWTMLRAIQELDARLDGFDARLTALEPR